MFITLASIYSSPYGWRGNVDLLIEIKSGIVFGLIIVECVIQSHHICSQLKLRSLRSLILTLNINIYMTSSFSQFEFLGRGNPAIYQIISTVDNSSLQTTCRQSERTSVISQLFMHCHHPPNLTAHLNSRFSSSNSSNSSHKKLQPFRS